MSEPLKFGIIGLNYGSHFAQALYRIDAASLVAVADSDPSRLEAAPANVTRFDSADDLLLTAELDALIVATPSFLHERHIGAALDRGLHVLCLSPVGINQREASHVVTSAGLVGKTFAYSNPLRFDPRILEARAKIDSGDCGEAFQANVRIQILDWSEAPNSWKLDRERGGGALLECALPYIDAAWFALGSPDAMEASAAAYDLFSRSHAQQIDSIAEDSLSGFVRLKNGSCIQISTQLAAPIGDASDSISIQISTESASFDLVSGQFSTREFSRSYASASPLEDQIDAELTAFIQDIETQAEPSASGKHALGLSKITDALLLSAKEKEAVSIKVERSLDDLFGSL